MKALTLWKKVVKDDSDFLERLIETLDANNIRYCLVGGAAVNAYADPVVSLDLDLVVAGAQLEVAEIALARQFQVGALPTHLTVADSGSNLRVQIQTDPRYFDFVDRARVLDVLGLDLPVADIADVLQGKVWAATDPSRRPTKRLKDLTDIARLLDARPDLRSSVPQELLARLN